MIHVSHSVATPVADPAALVMIRDVHKRFGQQEVLKGIDLDVQAGEVVVILGPSGSGKSTLLRCVNHLESIDRGYIVLDGEQVGFSRQGERLRRLSPRALARQRQKTGMVFQQFNLYPHLTALQNVMEAPVHVHHRDRGTVEAEALQLLDSVGLRAKAHAYPRQLSVGSSNGWRLPGRWRSSRNCCCSTNLLRRSTPNWWVKCWPPCAAWPIRA
jgi:polar amino acid transport system ATP-binding protein